MSGQARSPKSARKCSQPCVGLGRCGRLPPPARSAWMTKGVTVRRRDDPDLTYQHTGSGHLLSRGPACLRAARRSFPGYDHAGPSSAGSRRGACVVGARHCVGVVQRFPESALGFGALLRAAQGRRGLPSRPRQLDARHPDPDTPTGFRPVRHRHPDRRSGRRPARPSRTHRGSSSA